MLVKQTLKSIQNLRKIGEPEAHVKHPNMQPYTYIQSHLYPHTHTQAHIQEHIQTHIDSHSHKYEHTYKYRHTVIRTNE